jgi:hypothetical protein
MNDLATHGGGKTGYNMACSIALHFMHYNFCRVHQTLRVTPAMEAGITNYVWKIEDILALIK